MKFFQFICTDAAAEPYDAARDDIKQWVQTMEAKGVLLLGERLRPAEDATTVRVRGGKLLVTDGPFAETKEWVAGYGILECKNSAKRPWRRARRTPWRGSARSSCAGFGTGLRERINNHEIHHVRLRRPQRRALRPGPGQHRGMGGLKMDGRGVRLHGDRLKAIKDSLTVKRRGYRDRRPPTGRSPRPRNG